MPLFFIHIYNDLDVLDEEGSEHPDLASARDMAIRGGRAMMAEHLMAGKPIKLHHRVEIEDESRSLLAKIVFKELITIIE
jgi:hypothetical protein